jgi:hypothetical protein
MSREDLSTLAQGAPNAIGLLTLGRRERATARG